MHSAKHWLSIFFGLFLLAVGILPILNQLGIIGIPIAEWLAQVSVIFAFLVAFGGFYLIIDSFHEIGSLAPTIGWISLFFGFLVMVLGILTVLHSPFSVLSWSWWPTIPEYVFYAIFILEGILLFIAGFLD